MALNRWYSGQTTRAGRSRGEERREHVLRILVEKPGVNFRELVRSTGIPNGTLRHHADMLCRTGKAWWIRDGCKIRYFAGSRPPEPTVVRLVQRVVLDGDLAQVHERVREMGEPSQSAVLDSFPDKPRSTVQNMLERLTARGLLVVRLQGRYKVYTAVA